MPMDLPALLLIGQQTHIQKPSAVRAGGKEEEDELQEVHQVSDAPSTTEQKFL